MAPTPGPPDRPFQQQRADMVARQIEGRGVRDGRVLAALRTVARERFVPEDLAEFAYEDTPLPIGEGQTISQPYIVASMIEAAEPQPGDRALDVGTGSGYAAAVLARCVERVVSIERHPPLAERARAALEAAPAPNVTVEVGDGTSGRPEAAPFDVILVAAGGPEIPQGLLDQLAPGGRLVIPVGPREWPQRLLRVREKSGGYAREDLGPVAFVPLIGVEGWRDPEAKEIARRGAEAAAGRAAPAGAETADAASQAVAASAEPLPPIEDAAFAALADRLADARVVLFGEASHGTSEFYRARAALTKRLIETHGFDMVCVEADWPDAAAIDRHVRGRDGRRPGETPFARFPTWMWRNAETRDFVDWLRARNAGLPEADRAGFHGLDLYSLGASIRAVLDYLDRTDPETAAAARERYGCLEPWQRDPATYGRAALRPGFRTCEGAVVGMLQNLLSKRLALAEQDSDAFLDAAQNARLIANAEKYYRAIYYGAAESWNQRDLHMIQTLEAMLRARGPAAKAVVWAHNSHVGDARATEMGGVRGQLTLGQLARERFGDAARLVGFGTDRGTVAAASDWDGPMEIKRVRPALDGSVEALLRDAPTPSADVLLDLRAEAESAAREGLAAPLLERAIGVIYRPETERASHYFSASVSRQFDLYLWFEETFAVTPLGGAEMEGAPDTYPFGL